MYEKRNIFIDNIEEQKQYETEKEHIQQEINFIEQKNDETRKKTLSSSIKERQIKKNNIKLEELQDKLSCISIQPSYCYIILLGIPETAKRTRPNEKKETLLDLRSCFPSLFLRPHAQHGLLFRKGNNLLDNNWDYSDCIEGIIRIDLANALEWLGESGTLSTSMLFPSPVKDIGLQKILKIKVLRPKIEIVTA